MKKTYEAPKAEILAFRYSDVIVTSSACGAGGAYRIYTDGYANCHERPTEQWTSGLSL